MRVVLVLLTLSQSSAFGDCRILQERPKEKWIYVASWCSNWNVSAWRSSFVILVLPHPK